VRVFTLARFGFMKIVDFHAYLVGNPWKNWLFVRLETDEGIQGIGEGSPGQLERSEERAKV
jgi:galactonate dehydratase